MKMQRLPRVRPEVTVEIDTSVPPTFTPVERVRPDGSSSVSLAQRYSDHSEDIRTKGECDYCGGDLPD